MNTDDDEDMLEMWADVFGGEGKSSRLLENDGDDIIPNVSLPQQLHKQEKHKYRYREIMSPDVLYKYKI